MCSVEQQTPRQQRGPNESDPGDSADGRLSEPRPLACPASRTGAGGSGPCQPAVPLDEPAASVPRRSSTSAGECSPAGGTEAEAPGEEASERGPRPLNSVRREHVNPQEIGGAKETTASASRIASDWGDGLDNPAGPCGLAGRERRLPPAVPTLAPDPPPVRYEPRRATEATAARRAGERRKLSQHSKSSRPPRSNANDGCASLLLTCLFCRCREPCLTLPLRCCLVALLAPLCRACGRAGACCPCDPHRLCRPPADAAAATPPQSPPTSPPRRGVHTARGSLIDEVHVRPKFDFAPCEECCEVVEVVDLCIECSNLCFRA
ncbi:uncharacterized protein LOC144934700 [Lampetra fluviatilis]